MSQHPTAVTLSTELSKTIYQDAQPSERMTSVRSSHTRITISGAMLEL